MLLYRASRPYIAILGIRASGEYGDMSRHPDARAHPRPGHPADGRAVYFFNANVARTQILAQTADSPNAIWLDLGVSVDLDIGTSDMLRDLIERLHQENIDVLLAQVRGSVRRRMQLTGLSEVVGQDCIFLSVPAAVAAFQASESGSAARVAAESARAAAATSATVAQRARRPAISQGKSKEYHDEPGATTTTGQSNHAACRGHRGDLVLGVADHGPGAHPDVDPCQPAGPRCVAVQRSTKRRACAQPGAVRRDRLSVVHRRGARSPGRS